MELLTSEPILETSDKQTSVLNMEDIVNVDFTMVKLKLQDSEEGLGWAIDQCEAVEVEYKRFLALKRNYPSLEIVPHIQIDHFWHQHILDTEKYADDCKKIFGYFLHHYPYFGMNGKQDANNLSNAFEETKKIYHLHFGQEYVGKAKRCKAPKCRTQCKPVKCK